MSNDQRPRAELERQIRLLASANDTLRFENTLFVNTLRERALMILQLQEQVRQALELAERAMKQYDEVAEIARGLVKTGQGFEEQARQAINLTSGILPFTPGNFIARDYSLAETDDLNKNVVPRIPQGCEAWPVYNTKDTELIGWKIQLSYE